MVAQEIARDAGTNDLWAQRLGLEKTPQVELRTPT